MSRKIKIFGPINTKAELENELNNFCSTLSQENVLDIKFQVDGNFLLQSTKGEYQQLWYGCVVYIGD